MFFPLFFVFQSPCLVFIVFNRLRNICFILYRIQEDVVHGQAPPWACVGMLLVEPRFHEMHRLISPYLPILSLPTYPLLHSIRTLQTNTPINTNNVQVMCHWHVQYVAAASSLV